MREVVRTWDRNSQPGQPLQPRLPQVEQGPLEPAGLPLLQPPLLCRAPRSWVAGARRCPIWVWLAGSLIFVSASFPQIMRIKPHQGQHIGEMSFLQHSKCECRPKKDRARQEK